MRRLSEDARRVFGEGTEDSMRLHKRVYAAATLFAIFIGSAAMAAPANDWGFPPQLTLVKNTQKASPAEVCAAKCKKAYRYCYSRGNQIGKPYVTGGESCREQKLMCMRACPQ